MAPRRGLIRVLAGVNGAGKSSLLGSAIRAARGEYFNPDEVARQLLAIHPHLTQEDANAKAWDAGRQGVETAIAERGNFTFETTLGGRTMTQLLERALDAGLRVEMRYVGLDSADRHIARVQARVASGGHDIPPDKIRERYASSHQNLIRLLPRLTHVVVYDNSREGSPEDGHAPEPTPLLEMREGQIVGVVQRENVPDWAEPIVAAAIVSHLAQGGGPPATIPGGKRGSSPGRRRRG